MICKWELLPERLKFEDTSNQISRTAKIKQAEGSDILIDITGRLGSIREIRIYKSSWKLVLERLKQVSGV